MEFFRQGYQYNNADYRKQYVQQISYFGFYDFNTKEPIIYDKYCTFNTYLYWSKDRNPKVKFYNSSSGVPFYYPLFSNGSSDNMMRMFGTSEYRNSGYVSIIFIPLINNGFLFINTPSENNAILTFDGKVRWTGDSSMAASFLIGLPPTNILSQWCYLCGGGYCRPDGSSFIDFSNKYIDFQNGNVNSKTYPNTSFNPSISDYYFESIHEDSQALKTSYDSIDINPNVCTLVKTPYSNGFMDNLYLMSTAPSRLNYYSFFSFGGRNFLNLVDNMVVELPNN